MDENQRLQTQRPRVVTATVALRQKEAEALRYRSPTCSHTQKDSDYNLFCIYFN